MRKLLPVILKSLRRLLVFDLLFTLAVGVLVAPLVELALGWLYAQSGSVSVTNADIPTFLLSPAGMTGLALGTAAFVAGALAKQAGFTLILSQPSSRPTRALASTLAILPRLLTVAAAQFVWIIVTAAPLLIGAAITYKTYLGAHDINWYLATRPPEWTRAVLIVIALAIPTAIVHAVLLVRWAFAVPVALFEGRRGFAALRRSAEHVRGRTATIGKTLIGWIVLTAVVAVVLAVLFKVASAALLSLLHAPSLLIGATVFLLGLLVIGGFLLALAAASGYAGLTLQLYGGEQHVPVAPAIPMRFGWGVLALAAVATIVIGVFVVQSVADTIESSRSVLVTAHRGSSVAAPENSLAAIRLAMEERADYCEIDVQELRDGTVAVLHDTDLMRLAGLSRHVWEIGYDELRDVDTGSWFDPKFKDERIPTLVQVIELVDDRMMLNIELKIHGHEKGLEERVIKILREHEFAERCVITSLDTECLRRVRTMAPELVIGQIVTVSLGRVEDLDVDFLSMSAAKATAARVRANRRAGLDTHVWTVNDREHMHALIEHGVDNIITDVPALLREVTDERAQMSDTELLLIGLGRRLRQ